ncbi:Spy/CpxP family protein refolding chaperone [Neisseria perflava]|uniref:Spy/CpxP family protein refolding chaperone n=1 Tax=Neisseria perflava TaxID=33053 RepID=UPI00209D26D4|nr:Spy/CpxP family protein refolding chaperone [Neisseria perflava]MCP1659381.1 protein CpxP [Neisseria perflava]
MKKITLAALTMMTVAGLAACGQKNDQPTPPAQPTAASQPAPQGQPGEAPAPQGPQGQQGPEGRGPQGAPDQARMQDGIPPMFADLNLSEEQKAQIKKILNDNKPAQAEGKDDKRAEFEKQFEARRTAEAALLKNATFDEAAAKKLIEEGQQNKAERDAKRAEMELSMLKTRHAIFQVLTPEQQQKLLERKPMEGKPGEGHGKPGEHKGPQDPAPEGRGPQGAPHDAPPPAPQQQPAK